MRCTVAPSHSCVMGWTDPLGVTIATATTAKFIDTLDYYTTMIRYTATGLNGTNFLTDVTFQCRPDVEGRFYVKHVFFNKYFSLVVETKYACISGTPHRPIRSISLAQPLSQADDKHELQHLHDPYL